MNEPSPGTVSAVSPAPLPAPASAPPAPPAAPLATPAAPLATPAAPLATPVPPAPAAATAHVPTEWHALDPRARTLWQVQSVVSAVVVAAVVTGVIAIVVAVADDTGPALLLAGPALGLVLAVLGWVYAVRAHARWSWALTTHAVELVQGVWWHRTSAVPYARLQQIDVGQGPLERRLGLVTLHLRTAAAASDGHIPGIAADRADEVRHRILERAGRGDAV